MPIKPKSPRRRPKMPPTTTPSDHRAILARRLEVLAGCELQHGHHATADRLAWRAATLREGAE